MLFLILLAKTRFDQLTIAIIIIINAKLTNFFQNTTRLRCKLSRATLAASFSQRLRKRGRWTRKHFSILEDEVASWAHKRMAGDDGYSRCGWKGEREKNADEELNNVNYCLNMTGILLIKKAHFLCHLRRFACQWLIAWAQFNEPNYWLPIIMTSSRLNNRKLFLLTINQHVGVLSLLWGARKVGTKNTQTSLFAQPFGPS